mmetsp:Transcript_46854/g.100215  ORF Transcript_46854/g.100215 Transcript_46854/m.100215 type:complete len:209 (-) Transcript_46854:511-1137(-)
MSWICRSSRILCIAFMPAISSWRLSRSSVTDSLAALEFLSLSCKLALVFNDADICAILANISSLPSFCATSRVCSFPRILCRPSISIPCFIARSAIMPSTIVCWAPVNDSQTLEVSLGDALLEAAAPPVIPVPVAPVPEPGRMMLLGLPVPLPEPVRLPLPLPFPDSLRLPLPLEAVCCICEVMVIAFADRNDGAPASSGDVKCLPAT